MGFGGKILGFVAIIRGFTCLILEQHFTNCMFHADQSVVCQLCSLQNRLLLISDACHAFLCSWDTLVSSNGGSLKAKSHSLKSSQLIKVQWAALLIEREGSRWAVMNWLLLSLSSKEQVSNYFRCHRLSSIELSPSSLLSLFSFFSFLLLP